jgi:DNA topoisomerase-1
LAIIAKKEKTISAFVSAPYWEVGCTAKGVEFEHSHGRFEKKDEAEKAKAMTASPATVKKVERKEYLQPPAPPFDLTSLQVEAYRALNYPPAKTLEYAQTLYEASLISYPRTSSQKLSEKLNLRKIIEALSHNATYAKSAGSLLAAGRWKPLEGKKDDPAHPAIHPTGRSGNAGEKEMRLYDLIVKRFLSCFAESAKREAAKVEILAGSEGYDTSGHRTVSPGWFEIYAPYLKLDETTLPAFSEGEKVEITPPKIVEKKTQPPKRYTSASIISELERLGLGTKATRATIVDTLFKRGYVEGTSIKTTTFGMAVFDLLTRVSPEIMDEDMTHEIEDEMEKIADGENEKKAIENGKKVLETILKKFDGKEREIGMDLLSGLRQKDFTDSMLGKCPKCGGNLRVIQSRAGKQFVGCGEYPKCTNTYPLPQMAKIIPIGKVCEKCNTPMIRVIRKGKKPFEMCLDPNCETKKSWGTYTPKPAAPSTAKPEDSAPGTPASATAAAQIMKKETAAPKKPARSASAKVIKKRAPKKG